MVIEDEVLPHWMEQDHVALWIVLIIIDDTFKDSYFVHVSSYLWAWKEKYGFRVCMIISDQ